MAENFELMMRRKEEYARKQTYGDDEGNLFRNRLDTEVGKKEISEEELRQMAIGEAAAQAAARKKAD